jgi:hypothetical protein
LLGGSILEKGLFQVYFSGHYINIYMVYCSFEICIDLPRLFFSSNHFEFRPTNFGVQDPYPHIWGWSQQHFRGVDAEIQEVIHSTKEVDVP